MNPRLLRNSVPITLVIIALGSYFAGAGDLNPPVGPVAPTHKTLTEVEPRIAINATNTPGDADSLFKITQRGSYYLAGNISGVSGKRGIEISASGVTVDLNGFDLSGIPGMGMFEGVSTSVDNLKNITIRNGSVRGWGATGVDLLAFSATNSAIIDLRVSGNAGEGISAGDYCMITGCSASFNTGHGILSFSASMIGSCTATFNSGNGIETIGDSTVCECAVVGNTMNGISTSDGCVISNCSASQNSASGILAGTGSTISHCATSINVLDGITVSDGCLVLANTCTSNGNGGSGAGIHATGSDNRIEGNHCSRADRGIDVDFAGNIIIKNTCSGNTTDWDIVANNVYGPIIDRRAPASAAVSGFSAPDSTGSTHPNANFSY